MPWPKLSRDTEITPGARAADAFIKIWTILPLSIRSIVSDFVKDLVSHTITLKADPADAATFVVLRGTDPADSTRNLWFVTQQGDGVFYDLAQAGTSPQWSVDPAGVVSLGSGGVIKIANKQVVGPQQPAPSVAYTAPTGGTTVDTVARASMAQLEAQVLELRAILHTSGTTA